MYLFHLMRNTSENLARMLCKITYECVCVYVCTWFEVMFHFANGLLGGVEYYILLPPDKFNFMLKSALFHSVLCLPRILSGFKSRHCLHNIFLYLLSYLRQKCQSEFLRSQNIDHRVTIQMRILTMEPMYISSVISGYLRYKYRALAFTDSLPPLSL